MAEQEYLTVKEVAERLSYAPCTITDKMHDGTFICGVHWFKRKGKSNNGTADKATNKAA